MVPQPPTGQSLEKEIMYSPIIEAEMSWEAARIWRYNITYFQIFFNFVYIRK
jgi:hypothetical protein